MMERTFNFDMDGTLNRFYEVDNWLERIRAYDATPYLEAEPMLRLSTLAYYIHKAQRNGWHVNIISWLSKDPDPTYGEAVTQAKRDWLAKHLPSVDFDAIIIVPYGTPKHELAKGILFDDEVANRDNWNNANKSNHAFDADMILQVMRDLIE